VHHATRQHIQPTKTLKQLMGAPATPTALAEHAESALVHV
jgi:hypothetical protein